MKTMTTIQTTHSLVLMAALTGLLLCLPGTVQAHCDALDGPVVTEARAALASGDVTAVLKWIAPEDETTIRQRFAKTLQAREAGGETRELVDMYFFETLVRLHRDSEGAPYTGLKPAGTDPGPAVRAADAALANETVDALAEKVAEHAANGIRQRFSKAKEAKAHSNHSVEAGRKYVHAYVEFVHYVENLHAAIAGHGEHHDDGSSAQAGEHQH